MTAVGAGALAWSLVEAQCFTVRTHVVPVLAPDSAPIRLLHVSDTHLAPRQRRKQEWIRSLAELRPDLVVITGDLMGARDVLTETIEAFAPLLQHPGLFVFGSNDYYAPAMKNPLRYFGRKEASSTGNPPDLPTEELAAAWREAGWIDLRNARAELEVAGTRVRAVGVDDPHIQRDRFPEPADGAANGDRPTEAGSVHLGVSHAPYARVLDAMTADGCDLLLAGHTHGGQICVPGYGALVTNCDLDTARASGLHGWPGPRPDAEGGDASAWLNVSAGLGTSPFTPIRLACRPEVSLLTLTARD